MGDLTVKTVLNRLVPFTGFCYQDVRWIENSGVIEVSLRARRNSKGKCSGCHQQGPCYDDLDERMWRFVPMWGVPVFFRYTPRRIDCRGCGVKVEVMPWATGKWRLADAFRLFLAKWARKLSWSETAECFGVSWHDVFESVKWVVDWGKANRELGSIEAIGVDEIQVRKGRKFWTLVYQIDEHCRRLLWVGRDRSAPTLRQFFSDLGSEVTAGIRFVCSDMWGAYLKVVAEKLPHALHVLDRFHIRKMQNEAVDDVVA